jgi:hypothetical protein
MTMNHKTHNVALWLKFLETHCAERGYFQDERSPWKAFHAERVDENKLWLGYFEIINGDVCYECLYQYTFQPCTSHEAFEHEVTKIAVQFDLLGGQRFELEPESPDWHQALRCMGVFYTRHATPYQLEVTRA